MIYRQNDLVQHILANRIKPTTPQHIYTEAGLIYIRYHATVDTKPNEQKKLNPSAYKRCLALETKSNSPKVHLQA